MKKFIKALLFHIVTCLSMITSHTHSVANINHPYQLLEKIDVTSLLVSQKRNLLVYGYTRSYQANKVIAFLIGHFLYGNPLQYKNKTLPQDLSRQNLTGYDFTGCRFTHTNLTDTILEDVILKNTTCNYQKIFLHHIKHRKCSGGGWYDNSVSKQLKRIARVYPKLRSNAQKAKLLHIASGLAWLPFYQKDAFYIKAGYWSCELIQLKKELGDESLFCSLSGDLNYDANICCWKTNYPQDKLTLNHQAPHANFDIYLNNFIYGLKLYECTSMASLGFSWYKKGIKNSIKALQKAYDKVKKKEIQVAMFQVASALSKSYQVSNMDFLHHYLLYQSSLVNIENSVEPWIRNDLYYRIMFCRNHVAIN